LPEFQKWMITTPLGKSALSVDQRIKPIHTGNHRLGFLRLSVAKSLSRIEALSIKSEQFDRFVDALCSIPKLSLGSGASVSGRWNCPSKRSTY
jgi:hypothetical protein